LIVATSTSSSPLSARPRAMKPDEPGSPVVLVVDDTPDTLRFVNNALDASGMTVVVAVDGASAIRIARRMAPDVVLLDALMPGMDGFETCRLLKLEPTMSGVPIIFMTGLSETDDIVRAFDAGGVDYLTKPIIVEEMLARIHAHIANARAPARLWMFRAASCSRSAEPGR
jgi:DNA-binding response OmpR family regulator